MLMNVTHSTLLVIVVIVISAFAASVNHRGLNLLDLPPELLVFIFSRTGKSIRAAFLVSRYSSRIARAAFFHLPEDAIAQRLFDTVTAAPQSDTLLTILHFGHRLSTNGISDDRKYNIGCALAVPWMGFGRAHHLDALFDRMTVEHLRQPFMVELIAGYLAHNSRNLRYESTKRVLYFLEGLEAQDETVLKVLNLFARSTGMALQTAIEQSVNYDWDYWSRASF